MLQQVTYTCKWHISDYPLQHQRLSWCILTRILPFVVAQWNKKHPVQTYAWSKRTNWLVRLALPEKLVAVLIGACRPRHTLALPGLFQIMHTHITRTGCEDPLYGICMLMRTYSIQCSDKIRFQQLYIKCGVAKFHPGTHTALQAPMAAL